MKWRRGWSNTTQSSTALLLSSRKCDARRRRGERSSFQFPDYSRRQVERSKVPKVPFKSGITSVASSVAASVAASELPLQLFKLFLQLLKLLPLLTLLPLPQLLKLSSVTCLSWFIWRPQLPILPSPPSFPLTLFSSSPASSI
jgi:hypothetical protein